MKTYDPIQRLYQGTALGEMKEDEHGDWVKLEDVKNILQQLKDNDMLSCLNANQELPDGECPCVVCEANSVLKSL